MISVLVVLLLSTLIGYLCGNATAGLAVGVLLVALSIWLGPVH